MAASRRASPAPATQRRVIPIKRADGEPLTRVDIQYAFLHDVFDNKQEVFTDPYSANADGKKLCFRDLYIKALLHSSKASKGLKDKLIQSPAYMLDFAMLSLLVNVGRVNTTMSFFPEMKTAIRTYHPIPSLQRTDGNMQDAPRIKHILKATLLEDEAKNSATTPGDILALAKSGKPPFTGITNLIFVLAHHTGPIGQSHFNGRSDFLDLFLRSDFSSSSRAKAFLWLCYNYLESPSSEDDYDEDPSPNPFSDSSKQFSPPSLTILTPAEALEENREPPEDVALAQRLIAQRARIVQSQGTKESGKASNSVSGSVVGDDDDDESVPATENGKGKGKRAATTASAKSKGKRVAKEKKVPATKPKDNPKLRDPLRMAIDFSDDEEDDAFLDALLEKRPIPSGRSNHQGQDPESFSNLYPSAKSSQGVQKRTYEHTSKANRYSPYGLHHPKSNDTYRPRYKLSPRSTLQHAWQVILSSDPLVDSDDEVGGDEYTRQDYIQRLQVINQLSQQYWPGEQSS